MSCKIMVLPSRDPAKMRVIHLPDDMEMQEAYRYVTGVIAGVEEDSSDYQWEDIEDALEARGIQSIDFILGPALD